MTYNILYGLRFSLDPNLRLWTAETAAKPSAGLIMHVT